MSSSKICQKLFQHVVKRVSEPLELIHSDVANLKSIGTRGRERYYITFVDDTLDFVYLLRNKDGAEDTFIKYKIGVKNQLDRKH